MAAGETRVTRTGGEERVAKTGGDTRTVSEAAAGATIVPLAVHQDRLRRSN